jgi:GAF domain-containing protein
LSSEVRTPATHEQRATAPALQEMVNQLNEFLTTLHGKLSKEAIIAEAVFRCKEMMKTTAASIFLIEHDIHKRDKEPLRLVMKDCIGYDKIKGSKENGYQGQGSLEKFEYEVSSQTGQGITALIAQKREGVLVRSREEFTRLFKQYYLGKFDNYYWNNPSKIESFVGVSLLFSDECIGVLKVESDQLNFYSDEHLIFMKNLATIVAATLNSATIFAEVIEVTEDLASTRSPFEILHRIVESCAHISHAEAASLLLYDLSQKGLILRMDYGHDHDLSNIFGTEENPHKYIYRSGDDPKGITWECYETREPKELNNAQEVSQEPAHANKLWPYQWNDPNKTCHSVYMVPIIGDVEPGEPGACYGVLKLENKLDLIGIPVKQGGFTENDKSLLEVFANALAIHLADPSISFDKAYQPEQLFGMPILTTISENSFEQTFSNLIDLETTLPIICGFIKNIQKKPHSLKALGEYTNEILRVSCRIAEKFGFQEISEVLLKVFRDYEVILKNIPGYRLHFVHQFNVFLLGLVIAAKVKSLREVFEKTIGKTFLKEWFIASMFHDFGILVEKQDKIFHLYVTDSLNLKREITLPSINMSILSIEDYLRVYNEIEDCISQLFGNDKIKEAMRSTLHAMTDIKAGTHNHALLSACMIARALKHTSLTSESIWRIVSAIVLHDVDIWNSLFTKIAGDDSLVEAAKDSVELSKAPLFFLLSICDLIQNYGRPKMYNFDNFDDLNIHLGKIEASENEITISLHYSKAPHNWGSIYDEIIAKQANILSINCTDLNISVHFCNDKGKDISDHAKSWIII